MKKTGTISIIVVVILAVAVGGWYAWQHHTRNNARTTTTNTDMANMDTANNAPEQSSGAQPSAATNSVTIQNFAFSPASITVHKGTKVTWTNKDTIAHTVTESDGQAGPASGDLDPNASYSFTFTKTGTFQYHCAIHPGMTGTVTVTS